MPTIVVLGMVTSAARDSYTSGNRVMVERAMQTLELDRVLNADGAEADEARSKLNETVRSGFHATQSAQNHASADGESLADSANSGSLCGAIHALSPADDVQRDLRSHALAHAAKLAKTRWVLSLQTAAHPGLSIFTGGLWIGLQTFCMGLCGEKNRASYIAIVVLAIVFASVALLLLELEDPFRGILRVLVEPLEKAAECLGR